MKKIRYVLFFMLAICLFSITSYADVDYKVKGFYVDADVDIAGSMNVKELIVVSGNFNGYQRDISVGENGKDYDLSNINFEDDPVYSGSSITNLKVYGKEIANANKASLNMIYDKDFNEFAKKDSASNGNKNVYTMPYYANGESVRMYYKSNKTVAFLVTYTVTNVVVLHNDVAELYWKFVGKDFDDISNCEIRLRLPFSDDTDNFKFWAHGELTGEIMGLVDNNGDNLGVLAKMPRVSKNHPVDIRMTFDKSIIKVDAFSKKSKYDAMPLILKVEKKRADDANRKRKIAKIANIFLLIIDAIYIVGLGLLTIFLFFRYDKEYQSEFDNDYFRDFLDKYKPEELNYLMNHTINNNSFSAAFLDLIYRKNVEIINSDEKDTSFKLVTREGLDFADTQLVDLLFDRVGDGEAFTLKLLKKYTKSSVNAQNFAKDFERWKLTVTKNCKNKQIYEKFSPIRLLCILIAILGLIINFFAICNEMLVLLTVIAGLLGIAFIIYAFAFTRRTRSSNEDYRKACASKKFLMDFGTFKGKDIPEIKLWDRYLVYATAFGIASKVEKSMTKLINNADVNGLDTSWMNNHTLVLMNTNMHVGNSFNSSISGAITSAVSSSIASSIASSASGSGGGFSSGGGGGGGGGGHGF